MKASWVPAHLPCASDEGESRPRMPQGHDILNVAGLPFHHVANVRSPYGSRTRITRMRVSYPEPLEERAVCCSAVMTGFEPARADRQSTMLPGYITSPYEVGRDGVEPPQSDDHWVTASLARQCMPTLVSVARVGVEPTNNHEGLNFAALPVCVPCHVSALDGT